MTKRMNSLMCFSTTTVDARGRDRQHGEVMAVLAALRVAMSSKDLDTGKRIHSEAAACGIDTNLYVGSFLVHMYSKLGCTPQARNVFDKMVEHDVVTWSALIMGHVDNGETGTALELFEAMKSQGCAPNSRTFVAVIKACTAGFLKAGDEASKLKCLETGISLHSQAVHYGFGSCKYVSNILIDMYSKCGRPAQARKVFDGMSRKDVISWTSLMLGYADNGQGELALCLYTDMIESHCRPDAPTFVGLLKACSCLASKADGENVISRLRALETGMFIHVEALRHGHGSHKAVANSLVDMYSKCGSIVDARRVFDGVAGSHDAVLLTSMMLGYAEEKEREAGAAGLNLLVSALQDGRVEPDALIFVASLRLCISLARREQTDPQLNAKVKALETGMAVHSQARFGRLDKNVKVFTNCLVDFYAKCGDLFDAEYTFQKIRAPDVVSWTSLISGYVENGQGEAALELFTRMTSCCKPDAQTFAAALKACSLLATKETGVEVQGKLVKMLSLEKAMVVHSQIGALDQLDSVVGNTLVDMYGKCGSMSDARTSFERMSKHDVVSWTSLIIGYVKNDETEKALEMFQSMTSAGCSPDSLTFVALVKACTTSGSLQLGKAIHGQACRYGVEAEELVSTSLVDFYGKCASMSRARQVFDTIDSCRQEYITIWNTLMLAYSRLGNTDQVVELFTEMQDANLRPSGTTFLALLVLYNHSGLVEKGKECLSLMISRYGIRAEVEHYHCLVDMLGRANRLDEAVEIVKTMPYEANSTTWVSVLAASLEGRNVEIGSVAFESVMAVDEKRIAAYSLMSNLLGSPINVQF